MNGPTTTPAPLHKPSSFEGFRDEGFPTQYAELKTAAHVDVLEAGIVLSFVILGVSLFLLLPASRGKQQLYLVIRICVSVVVGAILATTNFGYKWEEGAVTSHAAYKPLVHDEVRLSVGLHVGLRAINVTLRAQKKDLPASLRDEIIDYNEHFSWTWDQGRFGFGPFAGRINREFREAQRTGLPLPILWVVDYFTLDGEGYRFGRFYRTAGWYAHIAMWTALPTWLLSVVLLHSTVLYGALLLAITGLLQLLACLLWAVIRNPHDLFIPFEEGDLVTHYGSDFWLTFANGIVCTILGLFILVLNEFYENPTLVFFGIDPLTDYDEIHLTDAEVLRGMQGKKKGHGVVETLEMGQMDNTEDAQNSLAVPQTQVVMQRRGTILKAKQRTAPVAPPRRRRPPPTPPEELPVYDNVLQRDEGFTNQAYDR